MEVDEARADDAPGGIYDPSCFNARDVSAHDVHDFAVDTHGSAKRDVARAVDNLPAGDQYIEHGWR